MSSHYLLKNCKEPVKQNDSCRVVANLAHHILLRTLMQSMIWCSVRRVHQGHTNYQLDRQGNWKWDASYNIQQRCLKKRLKHGLESNTALLINQLISGEIVLMRVSKPKANTLNICCDVFVRVTVTLS